MEISQNLAIFLFGDTIIQIRLLKVCTVCPLLIEVGGVR